MNIDPRKIVGARIRDLRKSAGISQESLAALCGLHRTYVGGVERGERNISLVNIVVIARALKTKPSSLLDKLL